MSTAQSRLEVMIDVFENKNNRALIVPQLTVRELIEAIVQEFNALGYLSAAPAGYSLARGRDGGRLDPATPLGQQVKAGERLVLVEDEPRLPEGTRRPSRHAYLRDETSGKVYKLHWCPAIIGRPDANLPHNDRIAVDFAAHDHSIRVSRRHAQISEENGRFFIESLSPNPTTLKDAQGRETALNGRTLPLEHGDIVSLDQSQIALKFIVRDESAIG